MDDTELSEISAIPLKSPMIAIILAATLGALAIPTFYLKKYTIATVQVMLYVVMIACLIVMCLEDLWETTSPLLYNESIEIIFIILTLFFEVCVFGLWAYCIFNVRKWTFDYNYSLLSKSMA